MSRIKSADRPRKILKVIERDGPGCFYCGKVLAPEEITLDHWIPQSIWPCNRSRNLRLACGPCNAAKGDSLPFVVAFLVLRKVRDSELWWRACTPPSAIEYRVHVEQRLKPRPRAWIPRPSSWPLPEDRSYYEEAA